MVKEYTAGEYFSALWNHAKAIPSGTTREEKDRLFYLFKDKYSHRALRRVRKAQNWTVFCLGTTAGCVLSLLF